MSARKGASTKVLTSLVQSNNDLTRDVQNCIVSIDIGIINLGYCIFSWDKDVDPNTLEIDDMDLTFDVFSIKSTGAALKRKMKFNNVVHERCATLQHFFNIIGGKFNIVKVIIERQVPTNTKAMELMYAITSIALTYTPDVVIFDPKCKFTRIGLPYVTKNKHHKKQSIVMAGRLLKRWFGDDYESAFNKHPKKDDIADALNQCLNHICDKRFIKTGLGVYGMVVQGLSSEIKIENSNDDSEDEEMNEEDDN